MLIKSMFVFTILMAALSLNQPAYAAKQGRLGAKSTGKIKLSLTIPHTTQVQLSNDALLLDKHAINLCHKGIGSNSITIQMVSGQAQEAPAKLTYANGNIKKSLHSTELNTLPPLIPCNNNVAPPQLEGNRMGNPVYSIS